jgi:type II secretory pathway component PulF
VRRILMVLTVAVLMVTMMALSAVPSFAQVSADAEQESEADVGVDLSVFAGAECTGILVCLPPIALPMSG